MKLNDKFSFGYTIKPPKLAKKKLEGTEVLINTILPNSTCLGNYGVGYVLGR